MIPLTEKYRPRTICEFAGLAKPKALLTAFAAQPYSSAWLLLGPPGLGKTTMALALVQEIGGQLHHIPSRRCDLATVDEVTEKCWYVPMIGGWHVVLCDEADQMTKPAQLAWLSKLDATAMPPQTVFVFTANATDALEERFLSRCRTLHFTHDGLEAPGACLLAQVWRSESTAPLPDVSAILTQARGNIRQALMLLEMKLLVQQTECVSAQVAAEQQPDALPDEDFAHWFKGIAAAMMVRV